MHLHRKQDPYIFLALPMIVYLAVVLIPIISSVYYSVMDWNGITEMKYVGLKNYAKMFNDPNLLTCLSNSLKYAAVGTVCQVGGGLVLAILVQQIRRGQNLTRVILFTPVVISGMAMSQTFKKLLAISPDGVVNAFLGAAGMSHLKTAFLADMDLTLWVVAVAEAYRFWGLYMVVFHSAFASIDNEVIEAASIDGAGYWKTMFYVRLPLIRPVIINCIVLAVIGTLKAFEGPFVLTNGGPGYASELMATYMYKTAFNNMEYGYGSALSLIIVVECIVIFGLINALAKQKE